MNHFQPDDELSPEEVAAFLALPRESAGHDQLAENRTVHALRDAGLLPRRRSAGARRLAVIGGAVAAAIAIFAGGVLVGRTLGAANTSTANASAQSPALEVQQAGTAYVAALVRLSRASDTERTPGLEAGAATLRAAATSLALVNPNDSIAHRIRTSLSDDNRYVGDRTVIWF